MCFVNGLKPELFREKMYSRSFENLDDVLREACEEASYPLRVKKSEIQKKSSPKRKRTIIKVYQVL